MKPDKNLSKKALLTSRYKYPLMFKENIRLFVPSPHVELIDLFNCKNNFKYADCIEPPSPTPSVDENLIQKNNPYKDFPTRTFE